MSEASDTYLHKRGWERWFQSAGTGSASKTSKHGRSLPDAVQMTSTPDGKLVAEVLDTRARFVVMAGHRHMLWRHSQSLTGIALTADGAFAICTDRTTLFVLRLTPPAYDHAPELVWSAKRHTGTITALAAATTGRHAITADDRGSVVLWDLEKRASTQASGAHTAPVCAAAIASNISIGFTASGDQLLLHNLAAAADSTAPTTAAAPASSAPRPLHAMALEAQPAATGRGATATTTTTRDVTHALFPECPRDRLAISHVAVTPCGSVLVVALTGYGVHLFRRTPTTSLGQPAYRRMHIISNTTVHTLDTQLADVHLAPDGSALLLTQKNCVHVFAGDSMLCRIMAPYTTTGKTTKRGKPMRQRLYLARFIEGASVVATQTKSQVDLYLIRSRGHLGNRFFLPTPQGPGTVTCQQQAPLTPAAASSATASSSASSSSSSSSSFTDLCLVTDPATASDGRAEGRAVLVSPSTRRHSALPLPSSQAVLLAPRGDAAAVVEGPRLAVFPVTPSSSSAPRDKGETDGGEDAAAVNAHDDCDMDEDEEETEARTVSGAHVSEPTATATTTTTSSSSSSNPPSAPAPVRHGPLVPRVDTTGRPLLEVTTPTAGAALVAASFAVPERPEDAYVDDGDDDDDDSDSDDSDSDSDSESESEDEDGDDEGDEEEEEEKERGGEDREGVRGAVQGGDREEKEEEEDERRVEQREQSGRGEAASSNEPLQGHVGHTNDEAVGARWSPSLPQPPRLCFADSTGRCFVTPQGPRPVVRQVCWLDSAPLEVQTTTSLLLAQEGSAFTLAPVDPSLAAAAPLVLRVPATAPLLEAWTQSNGWLLSLVAPTLHMKRTAPGANTLGFVMQSNPRCFSFHAVACQRQQPPHHAAPEEHHDNSSDDDDDCGDDDDDDAAVRDVTRRVQRLGGHFGHTRASSSSAPAESTDGGGDALVLSAPLCKDGRGVHMLTEEERATLVCPPVCSPCGRFVGLLLQTAAPSGQTATPAAAAGGRRDWAAVLRVYFINPSWERYKLQDFSITPAAYTALQLSVLRFTGTEFDLAAVAAADTGVNVLRCVVTPTFARDAHVPTAAAMDAGAAYSMLVPEPVRGRQQRHSGGSGGGGGEMRDALAVAAAVHVQGGEQAVAPGPHHGRPRKQAGELKQPRGQQQLHVKRQQQQQQQQMRVTAVSGPSSPKTRAEEHDPSVHPSKKTRASSEYRPSPALLGHAPVMDKRVPAAAPPPHDRPHPQQHSADNQE